MPEYFRHWPFGGVNPNTVELRRFGEDDHDEGPFSNTHANDRSWRDAGNIRA
jgi:hypothetical protein